MSYSIKNRLSPNEINTESDVDPVKLNIQKAEKYLNNIERDSNEHPAARGVFNLFNEHVGQPAMYEAAVLSLAAMLGDKLAAGGRNPLSIASKALPLVRQMSLLPQAYLQKGGSALSNAAGTFARNMLNRAAMRTIPAMVTGAVDFNRYADKDFQSTYAKNSVGKNLIKTAANLVSEAQMRNTLNAVNNKLGIAEGPIGALRADVADNTAKRSDAFNYARDALKKGEALSNIFKSVGVDFINDRKPFLYTPDPIPYFGAIKRPNKLSTEFSFRLNDVLRNEELQKAYPDLADEMVTFKDLGGENENGRILLGQVEGGTNKTSYNTRYFLDPKTGELKNADVTKELWDTLYHELFHKTADKEFWPRGINSKWMERHRTDLFDSFFSELGDWAKKRQLSDQDIIKIGNLTQDAATLNREIRDGKVIDANDATNRAINKVFAANKHIRSLNLDNRDEVQLLRFMNRLHALTFAFPNGYYNGEKAYDNTIGEVLARMQGFLAAHPNWLKTIRPMETLNVPLNTEGIDVMVQRDGSASLPTSYLYRDYLDVDNR